MRSKLLLLLILSTLPLPLLITNCASTPQQESTGQYIDNSAITMKVKTALISDQEIRGFAISVKTYKGVVELSGFVNTLAEKRKADELAREVPGVKAVVDALVVKIR